MPGVLRFAAGKKSADFQLLQRPILRLKGAVWRRMNDFCAGLLGRWRRWMSGIIWSENLIVMNQ